MPAAVLLHQGAADTLRNAPAGQSTADSVSELACELVAGLTLRNEPVTSGRSALPHWHTRETHLLTSSGICLVFDNWQLPCSDDAASQLHQAGCTATLFMLVSLLRVASVLSCMRMQAAALLATAAAAGRPARLCTRCCCLTV